MLIKNVNIWQLENALTKVNEQFDNNVIFRERKFVGYTRNGEEKWQVTLKAKSSRGKGARLSIPRIGGRQRHLIAACWHVHGTFFDNLPKNVEIQANGRIIHPQDDWQDWNIGNAYNSFYYSEACACE